jgi:hypothetical protein
MLMSFLRLETLRLSSSPASTVDVDPEYDVKDVEGEAVLFSNLTAAVLRSCGEEQRYFESLRDFDVYDALIIPSLSC